MQEKWFYLLYFVECSSRIQMKNHEQIHMKILCI